MNKFLKKYPKLWTPAIGDVFHIKNAPPSALNSYGKIVIIENDTVYYTPPYYPQRGHGWLPSVKISEIRYIGKNFPYWIIEKLSRIHHG